MRARAWAVLAAALLAVQPATAQAATAPATAQTAAQAAAQSASQSVAQAAVRFYADSGDSCPYGVTEGVLDWVEGPVIKPVVRVDGSLTDRGPITICRSDSMHSRATFTAYNGISVIDSESVKADDGQVTFTFSLSDPTGVTAIDRVVVRVCRYSNSPIGISYCGPAATYKMP